MSEGYDEYGNDIGDGGYVDPGQMSAADLDPSALAEVLRQNTEIAVARTLAGVQQQQQFTAAQQVQTEMQTKLAEAEKLLEQEVPGWNAKQPLIDEQGFRVEAVPSELAYQVIGQHNSMLPVEAFTDVERVKDALYGAAEIGAQEMIAQSRSARKRSDDEAFGRINAAHRQSWSQRRANVHQILDES